MLAGFAIGTTEMIPVERVLGAASKWGLRGLYRRGLCSTSSQGAVPEGGAGGPCPDSAGDRGRPALLEYAPKESAEEIVKKVSEALLRAESSAGARPPHLA